MRAQILVAVVDHTERLGFPPTIEEIAELVGVSSTMTVAHHLAILRAEGRMTWLPKRPRTLRVRDVVASFTRGRDRCDPDRCDPDRRPVVDAFCCCGGRAASAGPYLTVVRTAASFDASADQLAREYRYVFRARFNGAQSVPEEAENLTISSVDFNETLEAAFIAGRESRQRELDARFVEGRLRTMPSEKPCRGILIRKSSS